MDKPQHSVPVTPQPAGIRTRLRTGQGHLFLAVMAGLLVAACGTQLVSTAGRSEGELMPGDPSMSVLSKVDADALAAPLVATDAIGDVMAFGDDEAGTIVAAEAPAEGATYGAPDGALIVRTAILELEVADVAAVLVDARREMAGLGGYVAGSDEYDQEDRRWASVTYRVPVERFDDALESLRGLSDRVVHESTQSAEVTAAVVDMDARIANLRASEEALVAIMDRAGKIDDVLAVQMRLEDVRRQIEQLTAQRDNLADQAALATLSATWFTPVAAVQVAQEGWDLATEVDAALAQTVAALQGVASLGVWVAVVALPLMLIPLLALVALLILLRRRFAGGGPGGGSSASVAPSATAE